MGRIARAIRGEQRALSFESIFGHVLCATVGAMPHASTIQDVWK
jgi:hypothetical protein